MCISYYSFVFVQLNSYQVVIATNGKTSYVIFNYNRVEWTSPDSVGVPPGAGVGAAPDKLPVLGIGDGFSHEKLIVDTRVESDILDVEVNSGNTGLPGVWIFEASLSSSKRKYIIIIISRVTSRFPLTLNFQRLKRRSESPKSPLSQRCSITMSIDLAVHTSPTKKEATLSILRDKLRKTLRILPVNCKVQRNILVDSHCHCYSTI